MKSQPKVTTKGTRRATVSTQTDAKAEVTLTVSATPYRSVQTSRGSSPVAKPDKSSPPKKQGVKAVEKVNPPKLKKLKGPASAVEAPTKRVRKAPVGREEPKAKVRTDGKSEPRRKRRGKRGGRKQDKTAGPPAAKPFEVYATNMRNALPKALQGSVSVADLVKLLGPVPAVAKKSAVEAPAQAPVLAQSSSLPATDGEVGGECAYMVHLAFSSAPQSVEEIRAFHQLEVFARKPPVILEACSLRNLESRVGTPKAYKRRNYEEACAAVAAANRAARDDRAINQAIVEVKAEVAKAEAIPIIPGTHQLLDTRDRNAPVMTTRKTWAGVFTLREGLFTLLHPNVADRIEKRASILDSISEAMELNLPVDPKHPIESLLGHVAAVTGYNCIGDDPATEHTRIIPVLIAGIVQWLISMHGFCQRTVANDERANRTVLKALREAGVRPADVSRMLPWIMLAYFTDNSMTKVPNGYLTEPNWGLHARNLKREAAVVAEKKC